MKDELLTQSEAARLAGVSREAIHEGIRRGVIKAIATRCIRIEYRISRQEAERYRDNPSGWARRKPHKRRS